GGLGGLAADCDARSGGVDVDAYPVAGALDVHFGDSGALQVLGHHLADLDVLRDVVLVQLVGVPPALPVGRDAEPEPVRVNLLTHYSVSSSACWAAFLAGAFLAAFLAGAEVSVSAEGSSTTCGSAAFWAAVFFAGAGTPGTA